MHRRRPDTGTAAAALQVKETRLVARHDALGAGRGRVAQLGVGERPGDLSVDQRKAAAETTASLGLFHLDDRRTGLRQERARLIANPEVAESVAGVVHGDPRVDARAEAELAPHLLELLA